MYVCHFAKESEYYTIISAFTVSKVYFGFTPLFQILISYLCIMHLFVINHFI